MYKHFVQTSAGIKDDKSKRNNNKRHEPLYATNRHKEESRKEPPKESFIENINPSKSFSNCAFITCNNFYFILGTINH